MNRLITLLAAAALAGPAAALAAAPPTAQPTAQPPAGQYYLDKSHTSVVFRVNHLGVSNYTAWFSRVDGTLQFDPARPAAMKVEATIDPTSLELNAPPPGFHRDMMGRNWFDAAKFPTIGFRSTKVEPTGPRTAKVTGELTLRGVRRSVTLDVTYNGGYPPQSFDPGGARIGFSARGAFRRSAFGLSMGIPAPGSTMGVGDVVEVAIETEFSSRPPAK